MVKLGLKLNLRYVVRTKILQTNRILIIAPICNLVGEAVGVADLNESNRYEQLVCEFGAIVVERECRLAAVHDGEPADCERLGTAPLNGLAQDGETVVKCQKARMLGRI